MSEAKISNKKAVESAKIVAEYCNQQRGCQNCIFRLHASDHWSCNISAFDLREIIGNIEAKRKNNGYL